MSDSTINLLIAVLGFLGNGLILLQLKKRQDITAMEQKVLHDKEMAETRKQNALAVEDQRHKNQMAENENFKKDINDLKIGIAKMNRIFEENVKQMQEVTAALQATQKKTDEYVKEFNDYKEWTFGRIKQIDSKIIEHDANFGKVIVKEA